MTVDLPTASDQDEAVVVSGRVWNRVVRALRSFAGLSVSAPLMMMETPGGSVIALRQNASEPVQVKVTGSASGGGKYTGTLWTPPTSDVASTGDLAESELGTAGASVLILNRREVGKTGHILASSGYLPLVFEAVYLRTNSDGTEVYSIDGAQHKDCA